MFKNSHTSHLSSLHSLHGYASFGFKAIASNNQKYRDRNLYNQPYQPKSRVLETQKADFGLIQGFYIQKAGNTIAECEDIWDYAKRNLVVSIALADGATESSFSREWAREIVTNFVNRQLPWQEVYAFASQWLLPLQINWRQWIAQQNLSWFAKRKAGEGAFATFVSLEMFTDLSWKALAVGDSCLFIVRDHNLHKSFPLQNSQEFNHSPRLIGTNTKVANIRVLQIHGVANIGDRFYLATDAIACWIFKQIEVNQDPWVKLEEISSQDMFANWVTELRDRHEIVNDDTTLICLKVQDAIKTPMSQSCES